MKPLPSPLLSPSSRLRARRRRGSRERGNLSLGLPPCCTAPSPVELLSTGAVLKRQFPERGVALVITLVMLAVVTFMAVVFLAVSRSERVAVTASIEYSDAKLMADAALARAQADILAQLLSRSNLLSYDLIVSTNYFSPIGFNPAAQPPAPAANPTNVNYDRRVGGQRLTVEEQIQNIGNLSFDPRPPVFIATNGPNAPLEFRFYLDLNRNGRFDSNGWLPVINHRNRFFDTNGTEYLLTQLGAPGLVSNFFRGDPEWIGVLERPDQPHSASNRFVGRLAYLIVPEGQVLDLNFMHNAAKSPRNNWPSDRDGYLRNQGVGPWEFNLAALLRDLNTNAWAGPGFAYDYEPTLLASSGGLAFADALTLLNYRNAESYRRPFSVEDLFGASGSLAFRNDFIDAYSDGPVLGVALNLTNENDLPNAPWPGADSARRFFQPQELFGLPSGSPSFRAAFSNFTARLASVGRTNSSYDRYTFYRLLSSVGMDSAPALTHKLSFAFPETTNVLLADTAGRLLTRPYPSLPPFTNSLEIITNKINLNWANHPPGVTNATDFRDWHPTTFFTVTADRLLRGHLTTLTNTNSLTLSAWRYALVCGDTPVRPEFCLTNIQVWADATRAPAGYLHTNSEYTASTHRLLQLAANIYDATVQDSAVALARPNPPFPHYPSVFRPIFQDNVTNVVINAYREVRPGEIDVLLRPEWWLDLDNPTDRARLRGTEDQRARYNVWGVPWIIGAKKGFPNFNEFSLQSYAQVTRKLEVVKPSFNDLNRPNWVTNQMYLLSLSNVFGLEAWNSYSNILPQGYPRALELHVEARTAVMLLTNTNTLQPLLVVSNVIPVRTNFAANTWGPLQFKVPLLTNQLSLRDSAFYFTRPAGSQFVPIPNNLTFETGIGFPVPEWTLVVSNSLRYVLLDQQTRQVVDFVNLTRLTNAINITHELIGRFQADEASAPGSMWLTNRFGNSTNQFVPTIGILNQNLGSLGEPVLGGEPLSETDWQNYNGLQLVDDKDKAIDKFRLFLGLSPLTYTTAGGRNQLLSELGRAARYQAPFAPTRKLYLYTSWQANDPLVHYMESDLVDLYRTNLVTLIVPPNLNLITNENLGRLNDRFRPWGGNPFKDPASDTNAYSLALKDPLVTKSDDWDFPTNKFANIGWLGRVHRGTPWQTIYLKSPAADTNAWLQWSGSLGTHPTNDWKILDFFTTATYDNTARGLLSVNQTNLPAWSAVLSGVSVLANDQSDSSLNSRSTPTYKLTFIEPAGVYNSLDPANWPPLVRIVEGINRTRAGLTNYGQVFPYLGMIVATPELTVASPYLTLTTNQVKYGISDAAYERIPQQILGLLKSTEPRFTVYAFGQSLKPADRSLVLSGDYRGLCTNYQVTGEYATKTVFRIEGEVNKNPRAVIESYKVLPSE